MSPRSCDLASRAPSRLVRLSPRQAPRTPTGASSRRSTLPADGHGRGERLLIRAGFGPGLLEARRSRALTTTSPTVSDLGEGSWYWRAEPIHAYELVGQEPATEVRRLSIAKSSDMRAPSPPRRSMAPSIRCRTPRARALPSPGNRSPRRPPTSSSSPVRRTSPPPSWRRAPALPTSG